MNWSFKTSPSRANDAHNLVLRLIVGLGLVVMATAMVQPVRAEAELSSSVDPFELPINKTTSLGLYLTSQDAARHLARDRSILFLDVRSRAEVNFLGLPDRVDANIPNMPLDPRFELSQSGKSYKRYWNPHFVDVVKGVIAARKLDDDPVIVLICRSGKGSAIAANRLADHGFTRVYSIVDGFEGDKDQHGKRTVNGWKNAGLPWSYGIGRARAYQPPAKSNSWFY